MPSKVQLQVNNFIQGLVTEANQISMPEQASLDEINMQLLRDGSRRRRLGLDLELGGSLVTSGLTEAQLSNSKHSFFSWPNPGGSNKVHIGIVQIGNKLYFIDLLSATPSSVLLNGGNFITGLVDVNIHINFTLYNGDVVGVSEELINPFLLSYDEDADVVSLVEGVIQIRDTYGIDDGLAVDNRPTLLSDTHLYNLGNQGWSENIQTTCTDGSAVIQCTFDTIGVYPSNADTWSLGKDADVSSADIDKYNPDLLKRNSVALGQSAKGRFIIDLYDRGASRTAILAAGGNIPVDRELGRISTVTSYAGRIFYSGIRSRVIGGDSKSPQLSGAVLFTQIATSKDQLLKCYQEADPTSPEFSDLVDTDGGIIIIPGASNIVRLLPVKQALFVFAATGVWQIQGEDGGFKATSFQIQKVSSIGTDAAHSIIEANGVIFYWAQGGIYSLSPDQFGETYESTNLTLTSIQSIYNSLPALMKRGAKGYYDFDENQIRWLYGSDETKIVGDPIDIQPVVPVVEVGEVENIDVAATFIDIVSLSATQSLVTYATGNILQAVVINVDGVTLTSGTPVNLSVTAFSTSVVRLTDTTAVVAYNTTGSTGKAAVLTITGDSIAIGTSATLGTIAASPQLSLAPISSTKCVASYINSAASDTSVQVLDISGTTVTPGVAKNVSTTTGHTYSNIEMITATKGIVTMLRAAGGGHILGIVFDIAGSTVSNGIEYNVSPASSTTSAPTQPRVMTANSALVTWRGGSNIIRNSYITILGTVITLENTNNLVENASLFAMTISSTNEQVIVYADDATVFPYVNTNDVGQISVEGTPLLLASETSFDYSIDKISDRKVILLYKNSSSFLRTFAMTT